MADTKTSDLGLFTTIAPTAAIFPGVLVADTSNARASAHQIVTAVEDYRGARLWAATPIVGGTAPSGVGTNTAVMGTGSGITTGFGTNEGWERVVYTTASAAANLSSGLRVPSVNLTPGANANANPVTFRGTFAAADANTGCRGFMGLRAINSDPGATEPSAFVNCIGLGYDADMTQLVLMHNDASGVCTEVALNAGSGFPCNSNAVDRYELLLAVCGIGGVLTLYYLARNASTNVEQKGTIITDLPAAGSSMTGYAYRNTGANSASGVCHVGELAGGAAARVRLAAATA